MRKAIWVVLLLTILAATSISVSAQSVADPTFVAMHGIVYKYGGLPAWGRIWAFAEVPDKWAEVGVFWTRAEPRILSFPATYIFYGARLNVTEKARLKYEGYDFYISGLWNVYKITIDYDRTGKTIGIEIELIVDNGFGELKVIDGWTNFTVGIEGIPLIEGIVRYYRWWLPPPFEIIRGDLNLDGTVDIFDIMHVARRHETKPGIGISFDSYQYDFNSDINSDFTVDIDDLIIVAKDFGKTY